MVHSRSIGGILDHLAALGPVFYGSDSDWELAILSDSSDGLTGSTGKFKVVHGIQSYLSSLEVLELNISRSFTLTVLNVRICLYRVAGDSRDHGVDRQIR